LIGLNAAPTAAAPMLMATGGQRVEPKPARHEQQHRHERNDLLSHVLERAAEGKRERHDRDHQRLAVRQAPYQPADPLAQRAGFIDDRERAADQEYEEDDGRGVGKSLGYGDERLERADMVRFDPMVGACDDDGASRSLGPRGGRTRRRGGCSCRPPR
jgi:hypothetical protein